ncbi:metallophosphoesterase [Streptomyces sp. NBC_01136]|uniref:metallophosphoesterase family protein n=1 Tax=Streptomyces sp. NBC_01136 TaxID=2903754 RepID=UPI00386E93A5|nr:metallophosphoesterase [Streptomyces sp. NBC_01136]
MTAGSVKVIFLVSDDICHQDAGSSYVRGYSKGAQKAWLEKELRSARADRGMDWIVVCVHQAAVSTADQFNGADLAIRQEWLPLFDRFGVDLVVCGHEHHYERSHPVGADNPVTHAELRLEGHGVITSKALVSPSAHAWES